MHLSVSRLVIALIVTTVVRLAILYLKRLDAKEANGPPSKRKAISASRRRAQGHLWLLGVLTASMAIFGLLFGARHPPSNPKTLLVVSVSAVAVAYCLHKMFSAYGDASRKGSAVSG